LARNDDDDEDEDDEDDDDDEKERTPARDRASNRVAIRNDIASKSRERQRSNGRWMDGFVYF